MSEFETESEQRTCQLAAASANAWDAHEQDWFALGWLAGRDYARAQQQFTPSEVEGAVEAGGRLGDRPNLP